MLKYTTPSKFNDEIKLSTPDTVTDDSIDSLHSSSCSTSSDSEFTNPVANKRITTEHRRLEIEGKLTPEPLLTDNPARYVLFPIQNPDVCVKFATTLTIKLTFT